MNPSNPGPFSYFQLTKGTFNFKKTNSSCESKSYHQLYPLKENT